jgi:dCTP deaminase
VILTGVELAHAVSTGTVEIEPFDICGIEPNSYGFRLGSRVMRMVGDIDSFRTPRTKRIDLPAEGLVLRPGQLYLAETHERMGSVMHAAMLYASRSVASLGVWIQINAPLGHTGPAVKWTLEIRCVQPVRIYPLMRIGKISFWTTQGEVRRYAGKYSMATGVQRSHLALEADFPVGAS